MKRPWERLDELSDAEALEAIFEYCWLHLAQIMEQKRAYAGLYGDVRRVEIMNAASGALSRVIQDALFDSIVLGLCRLLDPAKSGRTKFVNLSFDLMISKLPASEISLHCQERREDLCNRAYSLRQRRDKHLAHTDLASLKQEARVGWVSLTEIESTLSEMGDLLKDIYSIQFGIHLDVWPPNDHPELPFLRSLFYGKTALDERIEAFFKDYMSAPSSRTNRLPHLDSIYPDFLCRPFSKLD
ncbi:hypothetical protein [Paracoccus gahaiensis]|nr:hypothetical protein [Paracoccus gahaiensis]